MKEPDDCHTLKKTRPRPPAAAVGRVARVIGPVVDVEFPVDQMPDIYNALLVDTTVSGETRTMTMEVALHIGDNMVRAIALKPTDGMQRGAEVRDTGAPISVPVGDVTKGQVWNVTGDVPERRPVDGRDHRALADPPPGAEVRPAGVEDRDAGDRHQGARPADPVRARAARSACSAAPASARPC